MKNVRRLILRITRKSHPIYEQLELTLPGSRLTRAETSFVRELRDLRRHLMATRT